VCGAWGQGNSKLEEEVGEMLKVEKRSRELIAHPNGAAMDQRGRNEGFLLHGDHGCQTGENVPEAQKKRGE